MLSKHLGVQNMEQRKFPRWPVAVLVSLGLAGAFVAVAGAIEGSSDRFLFAKAKEVCVSSAVASVTAEGPSGAIACKK